MAVAAAVAAAGAVDMGPPGDLFGTPAQPPSGDAPGNGGGPGRGSSAGGSGDAPRAPGYVDGATQVRQALRKTDDEARLVVEYIAASLKQGMYITIHVDNDENDDHLKAFQVLEVDPKFITVETWKTKLLEKEEHQHGQSAGLKVTVQPLELWNEAIGGVGADSTELTVYAMQDPLCMDIIDLSGDRKEDRGKFAIWEAGLSPVEGCVRLTRHGPLQPPAGLKMADKPTLCLLDQLDADRWVGVEALCVHSKGRIKKNMMRANHVPKKHIIYAC